jgi:hypothetical protein
MPKICPHCEEEIGYRSTPKRIAFLPGEKGKDEEQIIDSLTPRERAEAMLAGRQHVISAKYPHNP